LSRRLGDDPLTRARNARTKAAQEAAPVAPDSSQGGTGHPGILSTSHASSNDVFFQRRAEETALQGAEARAPQETPEISEISEIPEIREVAAAPPVQADLREAPEVTPTPPVSTVEEVVATLNGTVEGPAARADAAPAVRGEPSRLPAVSQALDVGEDEAKPEAQKRGGFFKRLFGKFK